MEKSCLGYKGPPSYHFPGTIFLHIDGVLDAGYAVHGKTLIQLFQDGKLPPQYTLGSRSIYKYLYTVRMELFFS